MEKQTKTIKRRTLEGVVVSDRMDKTCVVLVTRYAKHPRYRKYVKITNRFKAHDAENAYHIGDVVHIVESRPLSAQKRWTILDLISRVDSGVANVTDDAIETGVEEVTESEK